jgi:hypothetical protein
MKKAPQKPYIPPNQIAQGGGVQPLERVTGPDYDLKFNPDHTTMMNKIGMPAEEAEGLRQQLLQQYPPGTPQASQGYTTAMTETLKQRLIQILQQRQQGV